MVLEEERDLLVGHMTTKYTLGVQALHLIGIRGRGVIEIVHVMNLRRKGILPLMVRQRSVKKLKLDFLG